MESTTKVNKWAGAAVAIREALASGLYAKSNQSENTSPYMCDVVNRNTYPRGSTISENDCECYRELWRALNSTKVFCLMRHLYDLNMVPVKHASDITDGLRVNIGAAFWGAVASKIEAGNCNLAGIRSAGYDAVRALDISAILKGN